MNNFQVEQSQLAKEIMLVPEQISSEQIKKLRSLNTEDSPSLSFLYAEMNNMPLSNKSELTQHAKKVAFPKGVIDTVIKHEIIKTTGKNWSSKRNNILRLVFIFAKYFSVEEFKDFTPKHWSEVTQSLIDTNSIWRQTSVERVRNAARVFVKAFNLTHSEQISLRGFDKKSSINGMGRSKHQTQLEYLINTGQHYREWIPLFDEWINTLVLKNSKSVQAAIALLIEFLQANDLDITPFEFILLRKKPCFWTYLKNNSKVKDKKSIRPHALRIYEFIEWVTKDKLSNEEDGELLTLATPLLPLDVYHHVTSYTVPSARGKVDNIKAILPIKYINLIRQILTEDNHAWARAQGWLYKKLLNHDTGKYEDVWHPHLTYLYLFMLEVPVRKIQVLCLDSGEGDEGRWIKGKWQHNDSVNAGYWSKNFGDKMGRGVTRKAYNNGNETTCIYINTNKTQDIKEGFGATSGYTINWHNESIINITDYMRNWQRKYNPVTAPLAYKELPKSTFSDSPTQAVIDMIPDRFYLFRYPLNDSQNANYAAAPVADYLTFKFWHLLMNELECRLNKMGEDVVITTGWTGTLPNKSIFTPHSLRGSGLTALAEAGVPIEVLSKIIAGHASILMTLGYLKYSNSYISSMLDKARLKVEQSEQENYTTYLRNATWVDAYKYAIFNEEFKQNEWEAAQATHLFENRQIGICPNSGTLCGVGGKIIKKNGNGKPDYGAVPGGNGNCVRCRFLMTGLPFLIPLWLKANKDLSDAHQLSLEVDTASSQLEKLKNKRFDAVKQHGTNQIPQSLQAEIKQAEARLDAKSAQLNEVLSNTHATYNLVEKVKSLASQKNSNLPTLLNDELDSDSSSEFHEVSMFKKNDLIVQASRLYPHIKDKKLEFERNHFIDQIMFNIGMTPITLSALTESEKQAACDAAANYLNTRLSDYEIKMLESRKLDIRELGINKSDVQNLSNEIDSGLKKIES